jgi:adenine/guanine phosphoribosyltransferase-like PRPP-binding protein
VRDGKHRKVSIKEGDATGRHVVIVDDLVQSGGTLIEYQKVLAAAGAKHGAFPSGSGQRVNHAMYTRTARPTDLVQSGGTLIEYQKVLEAAAAEGDDAAR